MVEGRGFKYTFGLSFPGLITTDEAQEILDFRNIVSPIAEKMATYCGEREDLVLYDLFHQPEFARPDLVKYLPSLYADCELIVAFLCKDYTEREWCRAEWEIIYNIARDADQCHRIMFLWQGVRDDNAISKLGLDWHRDGFLDITAKEPKEIWLDIRRRYDCNQPLHNKIRALAINQEAPDYAVGSSERLQCDVIILIMLETGLGTGRDGISIPSYQWMVLLRQMGNSDFEMVPHGELCGKPLYTREDLHQLVNRLQDWIDTNESTSDSLLYIFAPDDLLAREDWNSIGIHRDGEISLLIDCQPFVLGPVSRLLNRRLAKRRKIVMERMHQHLSEGTGAWLPVNRLKDKRLLEKLDGQTPNPNAGNAVISAIYAPPSANFKPDSAWLKSISASMIPLVVWKSSPRDSDNSEHSSFSDEHMQKCLRLMPLIREDPKLAHEAGRPCCPDFARLAKVRHQWDYPEIDMHGFTILVDHPDFITLGDHLTQLTPALVISP